MNNRFLMAAVFIFSPIAFAQPDLSVASANIGAIRTPDFPFPGGDNHYAIYPELTLGGNIVPKGLRWFVHWGYWSDGVTGPTGADQVAYSYSGHIIGGCIEIIPADLLRHWPLPIGVVAGVAHQIVQRKYVGGFGLDGSGGRDASETATAFEIGLTLHVRLAGPLSAAAETRRFLPLGSRDIDGLRLNQTAYTVGLAINL
jgi:hypothetical protein